MYCKVCICGHINSYEEQEIAPLDCEKCGRMLLFVTEELYLPEIQEGKPEEKPKMFLLFEDDCIPICKKTTVGRNQTGKEWLKNYPDVSREHFCIEPRTSGVAATLTDLSSFGTFLNSKKIKKNIPQIITSGTEIRLASSAVLKFIIKGE